MTIKFIVKEENLQMVRGDTLSFAIKINGLDQDLDGAKFSCKSKFQDTDYIFQKTLDDGITKVEDNLYRVRVAPEDTENIDPKTYRYDLEITANGDKFTVMRGTLRLIEDVTRGE